MRAWGPGRPPSRHSRELAPAKEQINPLARLRAFPYEWGPTVNHPPTRMNATVAHAGGRKPQLNAPNVSAIPLRQLFPSSSRRRVRTPSGSWLGNPAARDDVQHPLRQWRSCRYRAGHSRIVARSGWATGSRCPLGRAKWLCGSGELSESTTGHASPVRPHLPTSRPASGRSPARVRCRAPQQVPDSRFQ